MKKVIKAVGRVAKHVKKKKDKYDQSKAESDQQRELIELFESDRPIEVTISIKSIIKIGVFIMLVMAGAKLVEELQSILILTGIAFFISLCLSPILDSLEKNFKIPRPLAIFFVYLLFFGALAVLFVQIIPIMAEQIGAMALDVRQFFRNSPETLGWVQPWIDKMNLGIDPKSVEDLITENITQIAKNLQSVTTSTFGILTDVFQGIFNLLFALVLIFFILLEREKIGQFFLLLFPKKDREYLLNKSSTIQQKMGEWIKAQIILMIVMGVLMYLGLKAMELIPFIGMKYSATIALFAAFMELFPYIGVWLTGIVVVLVAINISWWAVLIGLLWITVVQILEGNVIIPLIMEKVVGLSSVATILAIAIGGTLGNMIGGVPMTILGMILAVPIAACISIFIDEYTKREA